MTRGVLSTVNTLSVGSTYDQATQHDMAQEPGDLVNRNDVRQESGLLEHSRTHAPNQRTRSLLKVSPASALERSPSFLPQTYGDSDSMRSLFCGHNWETGTTNYTRSLQFELFYWKERRNWIRLILRAEISVQSNFWNLISIKYHGLAPKAQASYVFPTSLASALETILETEPNVEQDSQISAFLGHNSHAPGRLPLSLAHKVSQPSSSVRMYLRGLTSEIHHLDLECRRYSDKQVSRVPLNPHQPSDLFVANIEGRWLLESRFGSEQSQIDANMYILKVLHKMKTTPGINPLIGVVQDVDESILNSFFCELPLKGRLCHVLGEANASGQPIPWKRREEWCKQIVQAVAALHSNDFVIGYLAEEPCPGVAIDADDHAVFYGRFRQTFMYHSDLIGAFPPECRPSATEGTQTKATFYTDIYQLGLLLWRIATSFDVELRPGPCKLANCSNLGSPVCTRIHADPVELPRLDPEIPQYLSKIINACRTEAALDRKPACELVKMFPSLGRTTPLAPHVPQGGMGTNQGAMGTNADHLGLFRALPTRGVPDETSTFAPQIPLHQIPNQSNSSHITELEDCRDKYGKLVICDRCRQKTTKLYYQCNDCPSRNVDLCPDCVNCKGLHCYRSDHRLLECRLGSEETRLYSSPDENGKRDITS